MDGDAQPQGNISRTWDVSPAVAAGVRTAAARLGCWDSDLVSALLAFALAELAAGRLAMDRRPVLFAVAGVKRKR